MPLAPAKPHMTTEVRDQNARPRRSSPFRTGAERPVRHRERRLRGRPCGRWERVDVDDGSLAVVRLKKEGEPGEASCRTAAETPKRSKRRGYWVCRLSSSRLSCSRAEEDCGSVILEGTGAIDRFDDRRRSTGSPEGTLGACSSGLRRAPASGCPASCAAPTRTRPSSFSRESERARPVRRASADGHIVVDRGGEPYDADRERGRLR
jgi:hypothetical protein